MRALHYTSVLQLALHHAIFRRLGGVDKHQAPSSISPPPTDALGADPGAHPCAQRRPGRDLQSSPRLWRRMPALELRLVDGGAWSPSIRTACRPPGHQSRPGAVPGKPAGGQPGRDACRAGCRAAGLIGSRSCPCTPRNQPKPQGPTGGPGQDQA